MSKSSIAHRTVWLAGSSFTGAALASILSAGAVLAPTGATAQTATCTSGTAVTNNGSAAVAIAGGNPNNPGIACVYTGAAATVTLGTPATTVSTAAPGGGINLSATGGASINWTSTAATVTGGNQTQGPVIEALTSSGGITLNTGGVTGSNSTITHGIRAVSSGGGNVSVTSSGTVSATSSTGSGPVAGGTAAIEAVSGGGNGNVSVQAGSTSGRLYGILAQAAGSGNLTINWSGSVSANSSSGLAAIRATTGTGLLRLTKTGTQTLNGGAGSAIQTSAGGDALIELNGGNITNSTSTSAAVLDLGVGTGTTTVNINAGSVGQSSPGNWDRLALTATGSGSLVINNASTFGGLVDLSGYTGDFSLTAAGTDRGWVASGLNVLSQGSDAIVNGPDALMAFAAVDASVQPSNSYALYTTTIRFQGGDDTFDNAGTLIVGTATGSRINGGTLELQNLELFNNSGSIILGTPDDSPSYMVAGITQTDGDYDDVIVYRSGHFHGDEGSRVFMDVALNNAGQTSCSRNADLPDGPADPSDGSLVAADCLDFRGSAVSGRTALVVNDLIPGDRGAYNPDGNVLVDVGGADPADVDPEAFFLSPESAGYAAENGGYLDKGLFVYAVGYDADAQAFKLYGVESPFSTQLPLLGQAANDLWRSATAPWLERRVSQRNEEEEGELIPRFWMRGSLTAADRSVHDTVAAGSAALNYDTSYAQKDATLAMGMDLIRAAPFGGDWLVGAMAGYAQARLSFDASPNEATFEGGGVGLYSGFTAGPFYNDVVVNLTMSNLLIDVPSLQLAPVGTLLDSDVHTLGAQMETGLRFAFGPVRVEPLAALSWSKARFDTIDVPADDPLRFGAAVELDDARSTRAGLGLRLAMRDVAPEVFPVDLTFTGRSMQELDGESNVTIVNLGPDADLSKVFDGAYNELNLGASVGGAGDHFGAFLNIGGAWGEDYESKTGSVGMRLRW